MKNKSWVYFINNPVCRFVKISNEIFWKRYPALYLALCFSLGIASAFHLYFLIFLFFIYKKKFWLVTFAAFFYFTSMYPSFPTTEKGAALFHIEEVTWHKGPFHTSLLYRGKARSFVSKNGTWHHIPCRVYMRQKINRPKANCDYLMTAVELIEVAPYRYILKNHGEWIPLEKRPSLAEWRFQIKSKIKQFLRSHYQDTTTYALICALCTGNVENRILSYQFSTVGLHHLLAISGFHFALLTLFFTLVLKRFLHERALALCLILLLSCYFFYMGSTPSISRAWIGVILFLVGMLCSFRPKALNALGIALLTALIIEPLILVDIGFQLSFGATLGILLFYKIFEQKCEIFLLKRSFTKLKQMPFLDQCGYLFCSYIRKTLALNGALLPFTLPLLLFHFHTFPLISLVYNLFFPLLFSLLAIILLIALVIPGVSYINGYYVSFLLNFVTNAPKQLMFHMGIREGLVLGCIGIFFVGIYLKKHNIGYGPHNFNNVLHLFPVSKIANPK